MEKSAVVWRSSLESLKRRFIVAVVLINLLWIGGLGGYYNFKYKPFMNELTEVFATENEKIFTISAMKSVVHDHNAKTRILQHLRNKGMSLGQGLDIAEGIVTECKTNDLPVDLVMSLINSESEFYVDAKSSKGAIGIMQLMPRTFTDMVKKLNMNVAIQAAYDPIVNIKVGCAKLKELFNLYNGDHKRILSAYNAGENGGIQLGYVSKITKGRTQFVNFKEPLDPMEKIAAR